MNSSEINEMIDRIDGKFELKMQKERLPYDVRDRELNLTHSIIEAWDNGLLSKTQAFDILLEIRNYCRAFPEASMFISVKR